MQDLVRQEQTESPALVVDLQYNKISYSLIQTNINAIIREIFSCFQKQYLSDYIKNYALFFIKIFFIIKKK